MFQRRGTTRTLITLFAVAVIALTVAGKPRPAHAIAQELGLLHGFFAALYLMGHGCDFGFVSVMIDHDDDEVFVVQGEGCDPLTYSEIQGNGADSDQTAWDVLVPLRLHPKLTVGAILGTAETDASQPAALTNIDSETDFGGWFAVLTPTQRTRLAVSNVYADNDVDFSILGSTGSIDSTTTLWKIDLSYTFTHGQMWFKPFVGFVHGNTQYNTFFDTFFQEFSPEQNVTVRRYTAGVMVGTPLEIGRGRCTGARGETCSPRAVDVFARLNVLHDEIDGLIDDNPAIPLIDTDYVGVAAGVGAMVPVHDHVSVGGTADWFSAGDLSGYAVKAIVNVDLFGLLGRTQHPLFSN